MEALQAQQHEEAMYKHQDAIMQRKRVPYLPSSLPPSYLPQHHDPIHHSASVHHTLVIDSGVVSSLIVL